MEFLKVESLESAREKLLKYAKPLKTERVCINNSLGRVLAEDMYNEETVPAFRRSTVDGFAVVAKDTAAAGDSIPVFLNLVGKVKIGTATDLVVKNGECVEVPTGGMIPQGADGVVMCEYAEAFGDGVAVNAGVAFGENIINIGEDSKKGDLLLPRGTAVRPQDIGILAAVGVNEILVYTAPRVKIISTGDELIPPENTPKLGQIRDVNSGVLAAAATEAGFFVSGVLVLPDDEVRLREAVSCALGENDIVIVSGGSSKGSGDLTRPVFDSLGNIFTHGIAVKPGKPTILAEAAGVLLVGLPGHPVSAMVVFELLIKWMLREMMGRLPVVAVPARLSCNVANYGGQLSCRPCRLVADGGGYIAEPVFGKSGLISTLSMANGYFLIERDVEGVVEGEEVMVNLMGSITK